MQIDKHIFDDITPDELTGSDSMQGYIALLRQRNHSLTDDLRDARRHNTELSGALAAARRACDEAGYARDTHFERLQACKLELAKANAELDNANHSAMFANDAPPEWAAERDRLTKHCTKLAVEMNADKLYMLKLFAQIAGYRKEIDELGRTLDSIADLPARSAALRATMGR